MKKRCAPKGEKASTGRAEIELVETLAGERRVAIEGLDVAGRTVALSVHIPGNVMTPASWKAAVFVDDGATEDQQAALLKVFTGQLGGAIADLAGLIGEVVSVERVPITFTVVDGRGRLTIGSVADAVDRWALS